MKFEDLKFMSIGTNCADLWYLGTNRIHGPVDNIVIKTSKGVNYLLNESFLNKIYSEPFEIEPKNWEHSDDLNKILNYKNFKLVHNNPNTDKFKEEFKKRLKRLKDFISNINDKNNWLVFNLNSYFVTAEHTPTQELLKLIELLKSKNIFDKTIFIQLVKVSKDVEEKWDAWLIDTSIFKNVVTIKDVTLIPDSHRQFKEQVLKLGKGE